MLCELRVQNLALISSLELNFEEHDGGGLVVMTGETGAGKSIMLKLISLIERPSRGQIFLDGVNLNNIGKGT